MTIGKYPRVPRIPFTLSIVLAATLLGLSLSFSASAAPPEDPQAQGLTPERVVAEISPALLPETLAVIAVDVAAVDPAAQAAWLEQALALPELLKLPVARARQQRAEFLAAGGRRLYLILLPRLPQGAARLVAVAPAETVDTQAMQNLLGWEGSATRRLGNLLLLGPPADLARLPAEGAEPAQALTQALALVEPAPVMAALILPDHMRAILEQTLTEEDLPGPWKGQPVTSLTQTLRFAAGAFRPAPEPALRLVIQAEGAQAAQRLQEAMVQPFLRELHEALVRYLQGVPEAEGRERAQQDARSILALLTPQLRDNRLVMELSEQDLAALARLVAARVRHDLSRSVELTRARDLLVGLYTYELQYQRPAPDLAELVIQRLVPPDLVLEFPTDAAVPADFQNWPADRRRQWVQAHSQWIYLRQDQLMDRLERRGDMVLLVERQPETGSAAVAFADAHTMPLPVEELDQRLRQQTGRSYQEWQEQAAPPAAAGEEQEQEQEAPQP